MKLSREVKTALVAILVIVLTIWGYNFLKGKNIIKPTDEYYVVYDDIEGIIESGSVFYKGFKVGNINGIYFDNENPGKNFIVKFVLEQRLKIPLKSKVIATQSNPIVSTKDLKIEFYDTNAYYKPGDTLIAEHDPGIMGFLEPLQNQFDQTIAKLNATLAALDNTLNEETQANIRKSVASVQESLASLRSMLTPGGEISKSVKNIESVTSNIKNNNDKINQSVEHFKNISADLDSADLAKTISKLDSTLTATYLVINKINNSEGSAGLLVNDSALYKNLTLATASLDSLLSDMKEHPKRYVHFSVFGRKE
jgi:phospholipid/cholesterol/gamma-HCH transport system substrate-binding protein